MKYRSHFKSFSQVQDQGGSRRSTTVIPPLAGFQGLTISTQMCEVRICGKEKNVETCAHCDDFECDKIQGLFKMIPDSRELLGKIKATL